MERTPTCLSRSCRARAGSRTANGFTLVELVIVAVIVMTIAAIAAPRYGDALARYRVEAVARRIAADIEQTRRAAAAACATRTITFDPDDHAYWIADVEDLDAPTQDLQVELAGSRYQARLVSIDLGGDVALSFNGFGNPDSGGTLTVRVGEHDRTITISPGTGEVSIQ